MKKFFLSLVIFFIFFESFSQNVGIGTTTPQMQAQQTQSRLNKEKIVYTGFLAQDVEKAAKKIGYDFSGVDAPKNNNDLYGLRYDEFVVPLVKAVQELSAQNDLLQVQIDQLKKEIDLLKLKN